MKTKLSNFKNLPSNSRLPGKLNHFHRKFKMTMNTLTLRSPVITPEQNSNNKTLFRVSFVLVKI